MRVKARVTFSLCGSADHVHALTQALATDKVGRWFRHNLAVAAETVMSWAVGGSHWRFEAVDVAVGELEHNG